MENNVFSQIANDTESYVKTRSVLARLRLIGGLSRVIGSILLTITLILLLFAVFSFAALAAVFALATCLPTWAACLIIGAAYILILILVYACRKPLFINPFVSKLARTWRDAIPDSEQIKSIDDLEMQTQQFQFRADFQEQQFRSRLSIIETIISIIRSLFGKK